MIFVFVWLTSLSMIISRFIHVATNGIISFVLWMSNIPLYTYICMYIYVYIYSIFHTHSSVDGYLSCFHVLAFVNSATVNIKVHVLFQIGFPQIYTQEWNCRIIYSSIFSFLRNLLIVLHRDYTSIHFQQQYKMVPFFPYPLYCLDFLMLTILTGVK